MENEKYLTVSALTRYLKFKFDTDDHLRHVFLRGEISNFKAHSRGHYYFTLKDENSRINAIMFASSAQKLKFMPEEGMKVLVTGKISVYEATGAYQIYVNEMTEDGVGNLYVAFEQLKKKLEQEGLFRPEHKKKIPRMPETVGIITAPTGAAIKDILSTIRRRWPYAKTILFPSLVQGSDAKDDVVRQIKRAEDYPLDVLIVGRGGGSIEDLWCFNEEIVARAIYDCPIPVISAVGHEIDFTIADFVADLRAPTPTGAAEMAVPNRNDIQSYCDQLRIRLNKRIHHLFHIQRQYFNQLLEHYLFQNPMSIYQPKEQTFDYLLERLNNAIQTILVTNRHRYQYIETSFIFKKPEQLYQAKKQQFHWCWNTLLKSGQQLLEQKSHQYLQKISKLETLNPLLTLKRGYTIVKRKDHVLSTAKEVKSKEKLSLEFQDGSIQVEVL